MVQINPNPFDLKINPTSYEITIAYDAKTKNQKENQRLVNQSSILEDNIKNIGSLKDLAPNDLNPFDKKTSDDKPNGWKIKSVHTNAGYILDNNVVHNGPMHISNPDYGTDLTISGYKQTDRKSFEYLTFQKRFAPDEPQFDLGVNVTFENNFGIELDGKHNKIIMDGYDQVVHFKGMMNGTYVDQDAPLNSFMLQHENTYGNLQASLLGTYTVDLPAPADHKFSFITKAGPSLISVATHSWLKTPDGSFVGGGETKINLAGYGGMIENGLRYELGPKSKNLGLELTHSLSYLNYSAYDMEGGFTGSHSAVNSAFALKLTVGFYGNKK